LAEPRVVAAAGWGGRCGAEQREARRSHCRLRRRRVLGSAARVAVLVGPGSLRGERALLRRALPWTCRCTPSVARKTRQWLVQFVHDFGTLVWCQRCVGRIRGHRAVRMLRTSGRMGPGGPPTGTETSTFVLRVRDCQADLTLVLPVWWHCSRRPSSWLRRSRWSYRAPRLTAWCALLLCAALSA
jgi:hypothetical protein